MAAQAAELTGQVFKSKGIWHRPHQASQLKLDSTFLAPTPFSARSKASLAHSHVSSSVRYKNKRTSHKRGTAVRAQSSSEKPDIKSKAATALLEPPVSVAVDAASKTLTPEQPQELEAPDGAGLSTKAGFGLRSAGERVVSNLLNLLYKPVDEPNPILEGNFAPVEELPGAVAVKIVEGALPVDFPAGSYVRTGPNPFFRQPTLKSFLGRTAHHWFEGDGMLHGTSFTEGGAAIEYRNKYVDTPGLRLERERGRPLYLGTVDCDQGTLIANALLNQARFGTGNKNTANTSVIFHAGKTYAGWEGGPPTMVSVPDLQTQGYPKWYQGWDRPVTAHPKVDPETNEMLFFGFDVPAPHAVYGVLSPEGKLLHKADLKFERVTFMHDMAITKNFTLFLDLPLTFNTERLKQGKPLIDFETDSFARIGVMPRYGDAESIQWFKADIGYSFHVLNAHEDGEEVILHAMRSRSIGLTPPRGMSAKEYFVRGITPSQPETVDDPLLDGGLIVNLHEWRLNLTTGESTERMLSDWRVSGDFPRLNEGYQGRKHKYGYVAVHDLEASRAAALPKYGGIGKFHIPSNAEPSELPIRMEHHSFGPGRFGGEPVFVPRPEGKDEDDGWLVTYVYDENTNESEMYIVDAKEFDKASPTARIKLPQRVPYGFHGQWIPAQ